MILVYLNELFNRVNNNMAKQKLNSSSFGVLNELEPVYKKCDSVAVCVCCCVCVCARVSVCVCNYNEQEKLDYIVGFNYLRSLQSLPSSLSSLECTMSS